MKRIPYGIDDFERLIHDDYYFIDKTPYIHTVENKNPYLLFVRPRRMGKSLFVNMLMAYYDINNKDRFLDLFDDLWIGKNPTPEANSYLVLKFDFSQVNSGEDNLTDDFTAYCKGCVRDFIKKYEIYFTSDDTDFILSAKTAKEIINRLTRHVSRCGLSIYLFIDEYDNFSNIVLTAKGVRAHHEITHGEGFYREFFKSCKGSFQRIFMTGVTPVTYDDLSSGFNIADVVSLDARFDKVVGVTETELRQMINYYREKCHFTLDDDSIIAEMKPWYDGFCFCEDCYGTEPTIYNTDMVMRYMQDFVDFGRSPREMLDSNARTDYQKLNYLVKADDLDNRERRIEIIKEICSKGYTTGHVHEQFPASRCGYEENFKSMLYYFGTLTFGGWDHEGATILQVPNKTMGELYLQYMLSIISNEGLNVETEVHVLQEYIKDAAIQNDWQPLVQRLGDLYSRYSSIRNGIRHEADIDGFFRGILCLNRYFDIWPELELGQGFCDILLVPRTDPRCPTKHSFLIELKHMKTDQTDIEACVREACKQLDQYAADRHLYDSHLLRGSSLTKLYLVFRGIQLVAYGQQV